MYHIIWKYQIIHEFKDEFISEYSDGGSWFKLFSKSPDYHSSQLLISNSTENELILIDCWTSEQNYKEFINDNKAEYEDLSSRFERLYDREEKLGDYNDIPK